MTDNHEDRISTTDKIMNKFIQEIEGDYFIGREKELQQFYQSLQNKDQTVKILHHYGTGGVGKTFLLNAYARLAEQENALFFFIDSQDFLHTPYHFLEYFLHILSLQVDIENFSTEEDSLENVAMKLNQLALDKKIILAIDTYEQMDDLDRWFRKVFIPKLSSNFIIVLAGRKPLRKNWSPSPSYRFVIQQIKIKEFDLKLATQYLEKLGINDKEQTQTIWHFTKGHPLTLSLLALTNFNQLASHPTIDKSNILIDIIEQWLKEVQDEEVLQLLYVSALFHHFNKESLFYVLQKSLSSDRFNKLIALSFVQKTDNGWKMHDLIRDAIQLDLKHRNPEHLNTITNRIAKYFYKQAVETKSQQDVAMFFYHLQNEYIQSTFFQTPTETSLYLETVDEHNFQDVIDFFAYKKSHIEESEAQFYNRATDQSFHFHATLQHNKMEAQYLGPEYVKKMGYHSTALLKNEDGDTVGLTIIVPINQETLKHLETEPVSRSYFQTLSKKEREEFLVPPDKNAGWYVRHLDYMDPSDISAHSFLLYNLFTLSLPGGKIISSTPIEFFQDLLLNFGFIKVPEATSYDFGENYPSPTYLLDVSGDNFASYLKQFLVEEANTSKLDIVAESLSLTSREKDIVQLILEDKTNQEIADELYIAEITVKKHISRILKKAEVKNRAQLVRRIMEIV